MTYTAEQVVRKIAEVSAAVGNGSGEGSMEIAGLIISVLKENPDLIPMFMEEGVSLFIDGIFLPENGCLSWRAKNGNVVTPKELREELEARGIKR